MKTDERLSWKERKYRGFVLAKKSKDIKVEIRFDKVEIRFDKLRDLTNIRD